MTEIRKGSVVISKSGHDKNRWFAVLDVTDNYVIISDGLNRPIEKPKKKNIMHLSVVKTVFGAEIISSNEKLRKALLERRNGESEKGDK